MQGEIQPKFARVFYEESTNWGFEMVQGTLKYFKDEETAQRYAKLLVARLREVAKESDDCESVIMEDEKGEVIERWTAEGGKVVHHVARLWLSQEDEEVKT